MDLQPVLPLLARLEPLIEAYALLDRGRALLGVPDAAKPVTTALLWRRHRAPVLFVVPREVDAETVADQLRAWAGDAAMHFPARGTLPYSREPARPEVVRRRLEVLARLARGGPTAPLIVASVAAVAEHTLAPGDLSRGPGTITAGAQWTVERLALDLVHAGYDIGPLVERPGEAARRGGLLDVFPAGAPNPARIEFFGDTVESIRLFDAETQRTIERIDSVTIGPAIEWFPTRQMLTELATHLQRTRGAEIEEDRAALGRNELPAPALYGPLAAEATILDHLPRGALVVLDERESIDAAAADLDTVARERREELVARHLLGPAMPFPHRPQPMLITTLEGHQPRAELARWATGREPDAIRLPFAQEDAYAGRLPAAAHDTERRRRRGDRLVIVTQQAQRYREVLADAGIDVPVEADLATAPETGSAHLLQGALTEGWRTTTPGAVIALVTDRELFGFVRQRRTLRTGTSHRSRFLAEVQPGDAVVHVDHGIARFAGIVRRPVDGQDRDYLELRFAGNDRLYVPVDQVDRVARYVGPSGHAARLTRLGTQEWSRARARVRDAVSMVAADLLRLYAARQMLQGHAFGGDTAWQRELEAAFPHEETSDQLRVIAEVKADMESARPMDRIVCGDVGFGKTEVAVRAAFKAVQEGYQVAVLVPTTVLAEQHDRTFRERLAPFPVRVEVLSRFRTEAESRDVLHDLRAGEVDIVIGTHRLLQADVEFKNLGLVIIDEEQRFGVAHKERLKRMRLETDVLALSATPIPRTMHMALSGIRDMSTIDTAPVDRQPVQTYVAEWDDALVREALLHEMERGGQAYIVHNRVQSINTLAERVRGLVPEARIAVGHGQMPESQLKQVMSRFAAGEFDVLLCTTIIESGIDIPNVNTLIIDQADRLGLAQLYQLRGRVGRSVHQAYAYLLHPRDRILPEVAQQRLSTIFEASELGAGFQVALRDLEIRGAGNLLGEEQSGEIAAVGFDLYTQMLAEAVETLKASHEGRAAATPARRSGAAREVAVDLPVAAYVPETYVDELEARLALYQRIAGLSTLDAADALLAETVDRFGEPPLALTQLLALVRIRLAATAAGVAAVRVEGNEIVLTAAGTLFGARSLPPLPRGVQVGREQVRVARAALGEQWLAGVEALLRLLARTAREPAAARA